eukprot:m.53408 g.53408  ORF g.53408 m.53408 type:complete len:256 (+) comp11041_c0_seq4:284-1051(+)
MSTLKLLLGVEESATTLCDCDTVAIESEGDVDGSALLHHFISLYSRGQNRCICISFSNSFHHYFIIGRKLGVDLMKRVSSNDCLFVDGMSQIASNTPQALWGEPKHTTVQYLLSNEDEILRSVEKFVEEKMDAPVLIAVDGISEALSVGVDTNTLYRFIARLQAIVNTKDSNSSSLVFHSHVDAVNDEGAVLLNRLTHRSRKLLSVAALPTGVSKDVHGSVTCVVPKPLSSDAVTMHFKRKDTGVVLFPIGSVTQ